MVMIVFDYFLLWVWFLVMVWGMMKWLRVDIVRRMRTSCACKWHQGWLTLVCDCVMRSDLKDQLKNLKVLNWRRELKERLAMKLRANWRLELSLAFCLDLLSRLQLLPETYDWIDWCSNSNSWTSWRRKRRSWWQRNKSNDISYALSSNEWLVLNSAESRLPIA